MTGKRQRQAAEELVREHPPGNAGAGLRFRDGLPSPADPWSSPPRSGRGEARGCGRCRSWSSGSRWSSAEVPPPAPGPGEVLLRVLRLRAQLRRHADGGGALPGEAGAPLRAGARGLRHGRGLRPRGGGAGAGDARGLRLRRGRARRARRRAGRRLRRGARGDERRGGGGLSRRLRHQPHRAGRAGAAARRRDAARHRRRRRGGADGGGARRADGRAGAGGGARRGEAGGSPPRRGRARPSTPATTSPRR